jgi:hypothetical protein
MEQRVVTIHFNVDRNGVLTAGQQLVTLSRLWLKKDPKNGKSWFMKFAQDYRDKWSKG